MKLIFDPKQIQKNPVKAFDVFRNQITRNINSSKTLNQKSFYAELGEIGDAFVAKNRLQEMNKKSNGLAEFLVSKGYNNLAGTVYSFLIKLNANNPEEVEKLATKGLAIAKRYNDPVHIMARANDLRKIYSQTDPNSEKLLKILYIEKRALVSICKNYESSKNRYKTMEREMKPLENYEILLGKVKLQIAQFLKDKNKPQALDELTGAIEILNKYEMKNLLESAEKVLTEMNSYN